MFLTIYRNISGSLAEREMLWEHKLQHSFFEFSRTITNNLVETCIICFVFLENTAMKKGKQLVDFNYQDLNSLRSRHHYVNSSC